MLLFEPLVVALPGVVEPDDDDCAIEMLTALARRAAALTAAKVVVKRFIGLTPERCSHASVVNVSNKVKNQEAPKQSLQRCHSG